MSVIISAKNRARLEAILATAEGRATERLLSVDMLLRITQELEDRLAELPIKERCGTEATVRNGACLPGSHRWRADATWARLLRRQTGWALGTAWRGRAGTQSGGGHRDEIAIISISNMQAARMENRIHSLRHIIIGEGR